MYRYGFIDVYLYIFYICKYELDQQHMRKSYTYICLNINVFSDDDVSASPIRVKTSCEC